jgi:signal transduction histidine kinase/ligand-binding sensor domain-containing protein
VKRILIISALLRILPLSAQENTYRFDTYTTKDGLSHNMISCLYKDSRGLLWIGSEFGLNMFDGSTFTSFFNIPGDTNSIPHNKILSIKEDRQHRLWIGTQKGISCFNLLTRKFINYSPFNKGPYHLDIENTYTFVAHDNSIWIGHNKGIIHLDPITQKHTAYPLVLTPPGEYRNRFVCDFLEDNNNDIWAATSLGVHRLKKGASAFQSYAFPAGTPMENSLNACTRMTVDSAGTIYCGTWHGGIIYFDKKAQQFRQRKPGDGPSLVFDILFHDGSVWATSQNGFFRARTQRIDNSLPVEWELCKPDISNNQPLSSAVFFSILVDSGFLWLSTSDGLKKIMTGSKPVSNYSYAQVNNWNIFSAQEQKPGTLLILNGLHRMVYDLNKQKVTHAYASGSYARELCKTRDGYWMTQDPGLFLLDQQLAVKKIITNNDKDGNPELFGAVYEDKQGKIWLGRGRNGLRVYDPVTKEWKSFFTDKETRFVQIIGDEYDNIWLANHLIRYNRKKNDFERIAIRNPLFDSVETNVVSSIAPAGDGIIWISTLAGLYYYDYKKDSVFNVPLPANISQSLDGLIADKSGHLWMESSGKLVMYDIAKRVFKTFTDADGFIGPEMSSRFTVLENGNVVVGYNGGFALIDPSKISSSSVPPAPQFTSIKIDNLPLSDAGNIPRLAYNQSISFDFVSPVFNNDARNQYAYQLQPIDKEWNLIDRNTNQRFSNLPAGSYTFAIKAANASGQWNETTSTFSFIIRPPFWKRWWFISLLVVVIVGSLFAFYRYRMRQLVKMERLRTRIATDLHDDIGATLSSISMYSDTVKQQVKEKLPHLEPVLEKMGENSRDMVNSMSDIVWAINPNNDDGSKLAQRMETYARDLCSMKNILLRFHAGENMHLLNLPAEHRKNIYLIFKESLNNALKYAGASFIRVELVRQNGKLVMKIEDDGKGFDPAIATGGNGLTNIIERAKEINGQSTISSRQGTGTSIIFSCAEP